MRILVTGATGLIGKYLVETLTRGGHLVRVLSRRPNGTANSSTEFGGMHTWDPLLPPPAEAFEAVEAVVHLSGEPVRGRWTPAKKRRILESRVMGTRHLVEGIRALGRKPRVLVSASAIGYYGSQGEETLTENSQAGNGFLAQVTQQWEAEANTAATYGLRVVTLRTGLVLARQGGALPPLATISRFGMGGALGNGRQWWPWVHIEDVAQVITQAVLQDWAGPVNLTAPQQVRQNEFARALGRVLHRPTLACVPALAIRVVLGEMAIELLGSRRAAPKFLEDHGYAYRFAEIAPALKDLLEGQRHRI